jgi:hypothetical protein
MSVVTASPPNYLRKLGINSLNNQPTPINRVDLAAAMPTGNLTNVASGTEFVSPDKATNEAYNRFLAHGAKLSVVIVPTV